MQNKSLVKTDKDIEEQRRRMREHSGLFKMLNLDFLKDTMLKNGTDAFIFFDGENKNLLCHAHIDRPENGKPKIVVEKEFVEVKK